MIKQGIAIDAILVKIRNFTISKKAVWKLEGQQVINIRRRFIIQHV